ncbi:MAG: GNAT family N-acetyltransferase [Marinifilaceae bacterium]|jgi:GNAT superfamily N-acetyltransferase|nr:GNAT family N-acetyltransferase [Marinifilaceae bacterium]
MKLIKVENKKHISEFHNFPKSLYKNDKNYIAPLDVEIESIFDRNKNSYFKHGTAIRWILQENNKTIGRIAAFINEHKAYNNKQATGGCGFFECIDNREAAFALFDKAKEWLSGKGMEAMDGPINFSENDNFWGLLVDGYTQQAYGMPYNKKYYKEFFEDYGFNKYFEQYSYHLDLSKKFPERFWKIAEWVSKKPGFSFEHFKFNQTDKYINDILEIYNEAWKFHDNFTPMNPDDLKKIAKDGKLFIDEEFIWFAYHDNKPVAFFVMMPDLNEVLKKINGKLNFFSKLKLLYYIKTNSFTRTRISIMGVIPKYQRYGIESAIFWHLDKVMKRKPWYKEIEMSWVGDFNPKMIAIYESVGGVKAKTHISYRHLFDENAEFEPYSSIPLENRKLKEKA